MPSKNRKKLRKILAVLDPSEKGVLATEQLKDDTDNNLKAIIHGFDNKIKSLKSELLKELNDYFRSAPDFSDNIIAIREEFIDKIDNLEKKTKEYIANIKIKEHKPDNSLTELKTELEKKINNINKDFMNRLSNLGRGGNANRNILVDGNASVLGKYTDLNLVTGSNVTLSYANNDSLKTTDLTITGAEENLWDRTGTILYPHNTGDDVDLGTGDLTATNVTGGSTRINGDGIDFKMAAYADMYIQNYGIEKGFIFTSSDGITGQIPLLDLDAVTGANFQGYDITTTGDVSATNITASGDLTVSTLTSGRVPYITTGGKFTDNENLTFTGSDLGLKDNCHLALGTGLDARIYYDNTNLIINPKQVGTGYLSVLGSIASNTLTSGRVPYVTTNSVITDSSNLTFDGTKLTMAQGKIGGINYLTGIGAYSLIVASAKDTLAEITYGTSGQLLQAKGSGAVPTWTTATYPATTTANQILYSSSANVIGGSASLTFDGTQFYTTKIGIGTTTPDALLEVLGTSTQLRLTYTDASKYVDFSASSAGNLTIAPSGTLVYFSSANLLTYGNITAGNAATPGAGGQIAAYSQTFPVGQFTRDSGATVGGYTGVLNVERIVSGGTAVNGVGAGVYFKAPDNGGASTYAGFFGGGLASVVNGSEIGEIVFAAAWQNDASIYLRRHLVLTSTSATTATLYLTDKLIFTQTDGNEYWDSLTDGEMDGEATTSINLRINGVEQVQVFDGKVAPTTDNDIDLGDSTHEYKNIYYQGREYRNQITQTYSGSKALSDGVATAFVDIAVGSGEMIGGTVEYTIYVSGGDSDLQSHVGGIGFVAVNKGGTVTSDCDETYVPASEIEIVTAGTLTDAFTSTDGTGKITLNCNANTSLDTPTLTLKYKITLYSMNTITPL